VGQHLRQNLEENREDARSVIAVRRKRIRGVTVHQLTVPLAYKFANACWQDPKPKKERKQKK